MSRRTFAPQRHSMTGVFVFLLLATFAVLSTVMVVLSARLYRSMVLESAEHTSQRVLHSYMWNTIHSSDRAGAVSVRQEDGTNVLAFDWSVPGEEKGYETLIYCSDGQLRELLHSKQEEFVSRYGEAICPARELYADIQDQLLTLRVVDENGREELIRVALYASGGKEDAA